MTAAPIPAGIVSPRPAWRSLLWIVPLTVLWIVLICWQPLHGALPGVFALLAAIAVAFGLADFAVAITLGMITSPGRFQLIFPSVPSIGAGAYPDVLPPAFVMPSSILLHALSLRQLIRQRAG